MYYVFPRGIVIDFMKSNLESRYILSAEIPDCFIKCVERLQRKLDVLGISGLEAKWYLSLLVDRLRVLTVLHSLAITHGDLKEDHHRLPGEFHDVGLFDFSRSYTFTPNFPYSINGSAFLVKRRPPPDLQKSGRDREKRDHRVGWNKVPFPKSDDKYSAWPFLERKTESSDTTLQSCFNLTMTPPTTYSITCPVLVTRN